MDAHLHAADLLDPSVGTRIIAEMRKKGVDVVVLLGQLGKVENEDLVRMVSDRNGTLPLTGHRD